MKTFTLALALSGALAIFPQGTSALAQAPANEPMTSEVFCPLVGQVAHTVMANRQSGMDRGVQLRLIDKHFPQGMPFRNTVLLLFGEAQQVPIYDRPEDQASAALLFATRAESDCFAALDKGKRSKLPYTEAGNE
jgi:hypothetical protein